MMIGGRRPGLRRQRGQHSVKSERRTKRKRGEEDMPEVQDQVKVEMQKKAKTEVTNETETEKKTEDLDCGICFDTLTVRGKIDCCDHKFCHSCIKTWLMRSSSCPHCKREVKVLSRTTPTGKDAECQEKVKKRVLKDTIEQEEGSRNNIVFIVEQLHNASNVLGFIPNVNVDVNGISANPNANMGGTNPTQNIFRHTLRLRTNQRQQEQHHHQQQHHQQQHHNLLMLQLRQLEQQRQAEQQHPVYANVTSHDQNHNHMHVHSRYSSASSDANIAAHHRYGLYHSHTHSHTQSGLDAHARIHIRQDLNCSRCGGILYGTTAQDGYCNNCRIRDEYNLEPYNSVYAFHGQGHSLGHATHQHNQSLMAAASMGYAATSQCVPFSQPQAAFATLVPQIGPFSHHVGGGNTNIMGSVAVFNPL